MPGIKERYKEKIVSIIKKHIPNCTIYLYGSRARGNYSMGSDIDIAIKSTEKVDRFIFSTIKDEIEEANVPYFIDIVDLNNITPDFKESIMKDLVLWSN